VSELPTGTVTYLFTDVEGSTRLLRKLGRETYRQMQDAHASIMRGAIKASRGAEVRTEGDSFFVVFSTPAEALKAAAGAQRELTAYPWPGEDRITVRMGLHTGEGVTGGDDYVGFDVNRAARIAAAGHGGQVILSDATRALVEHDLPPGISVRDLGLHRLKDIDHREHLHDLVIDGLPSDFPALKSRDAQPTNLPAPRTSFIGRLREIGEVTELLQKARLLTITGPGGTGKTRLALRVAAAQLGRIPDGVFFVDLSAVTDAALVPADILAALRIPEIPGTDPRTTLVDHLRDLELLLVLDNMEQLVGVSSQVGFLLDSVSGLKIIATSRIPLRVAGEQEYPLEPLPLPDEDEDLEAFIHCDSVALFAERAAAVIPGFRITSRVAPAIAKITARLDGLPLALELAAGRLRVLDPVELAERLDHRLQLLTGGAGDVPDRHRTLSATIQWSHDLLDEEARRLFARLSVFAGGWTLDAAEAVCGDDLGMSPLDGLSSLAESSLVRRTAAVDGTTRFGMLETLREFAADRLAAGGEQNSVRDRHAIYFRDRAEEARPQLTREGREFWLNYFDDEQDNVRVALDGAEQSRDIETAMRIAVALWRFWQLRGRLAEGRVRLERLLSHPLAQRRDAVRARGLSALGGLAYWQADYETMGSAYEEAAGIARELDDQSLLARAIFELSFVPLSLESDPDQAETLLRQAMALSDPDDLQLQAELWTGMGYLNAFRANPTGMLDGLKKSIALNEQIGDRMLVAESLMGLAGAHFLLGDHASAERQLRDLATKIAETDTPIMMWPTVLHAMALVANHKRDHVRAARLLGACDALRKDLGATPPLVALRLLGDPEAEARAALGEDGYEREWTLGNDTTLEEAVAYALEDGS
jgi:predicted ATPase/class 3 adenylate cyclase